MKMQFPVKEIACLESAVCQVQNLEQTQELRIPEGMPAVGRILSAWGQILLRGKQWQGDSVHITGGVLGWVLYEPEDGSAPRCLDSWIPFRMQWDLPEGCREGKILAMPLLRYVDARSVSAGKLMLRAGISVLVQCWCPDTKAVCQPEGQEADVELLRGDWPVRLPREAGEKSFELEERLNLPGSAPAVDKLIYYRMEPVVTEVRVLGNKLVFRGEGDLHILYLSQEGQMHSWDFSLPFSQYADLESSLSADAQGEVIPAVTRLELDWDAEGGLNLKAGLTGQYLVDDLEVVQTVEDAYSPFREVTVKQEMLALPAVLDTRRETVYAEQTIPTEADIIADAVFLQDFPRQQRGGDAVTLEQPGTQQVLYYDPQGHLQSLSHHWEGSLSLNADGSAKIWAFPMPVQPQVTAGNGGMILRAEVPVQVRSLAGQGLPMVTELEIGERKQPDPGRPSLILQRAGGERLWQIARSCGSTVAAIQEANGLTGEPEPQRMLLIPVL